MDFKKIRVYYNVQEIGMIGHEPSATIINDESIIVEVDGNIAKQLSELDFSDTSLIFIHFYRMEHPMCPEDGKIRHAKRKVLHHYMNQNRYLCNLENIIVETELMRVREYMPDSIHNIELIKEEEGDNNAEN